MKPTLRNVDMISRIVAGCKMIELFVKIVSVTFLNRIKSRLKKNTKNRAKHIRLGNVKIEFITLDGILTDFFEIKVDCFL